MNATSANKQEKEKTKQKQLKKKTTKPIPGLWLCNRSMYNNKSGGERIKRERRRENIFNLAMNKKKGNREQNWGCESVKKYKEESQRVIARVLQVAISTRARLMILFCCCLTNKNNKDKKQQKKNVTKRRRKITGGKQQRKQSLKL